MNTSKQSASQRCEGLAGGGVSVDLSEALGLDDYLRNLAKRRFLVIKSSRPDFSSRLNHRPGIDVRLESLCITLVA
jgi:hypothetical protein